jgi:hypothetical protein
MLQKQGGRMRDWVVERDWGRQRGHQIKERKAILQIRSRYFETDKWRTYSEVTELKGWPHTRSSGG